MGGEGAVHLDVTLRPEDETVSGELRVDGGENESFAGWIGLLAALQGAVEKQTNGAEGRET